MEAFSDGVFAIAITLLVLDISIRGSEFEHLWHAIWEERYAYLAYVTSFLTIGAYWLAHHAIFRRMNYADSIVIRLNLALLMAISFLPFPTSLMSTALKEGHGESTAVLFYGACLLVISGLVAWMARYAARAQLIEDLDVRKAVRALAGRMSPSIGFYAVVIIAAAFFPKVAVLGFLLIAIRVIVRTR